MQLYHDSRYHDYSYNIDERGGAVDIDALSQVALIRRQNNNMMSSSYAQLNDNGQRTLPSSSIPHPRVICFHINDCNDLPSLKRNSRHSIPVIDPRQKALYEEYNNDGKATANNDTERSCRQSRSIESRTSIHPTCNEIHSLGFDDQMFDSDYTSRAEYIDLLAVGGANSVWKTTSHYNREHIILKTSKYLKAFDKDRLSLYVLDAMIAGAEGNPQLFSLLRSSKDVAKVSSPSSSSSSSWNHIMPIYGHCYIATIAPVASGTLKEYVTNYPEEHNREMIDPLDKLRLALQVARGLHQMQMYRYGRPTFGHFDLNPSQYLVFDPQLSQSNRGEEQSIIPILQINDFNRGRFLQWDNHNDTCPFHFDGCNKNTRGGRWHAPDRFIGCVDVNEKIDTFTLGGIFFFLLTDGEAPFYHVRNFGDHIKAGEMPSIPKEVADSIGDHPAFEALSEMVARCRALRIEDRPSSLEVVQMLEDKLRTIEELQTQSY